MKLTREKLSTRNKGMGGVWVSAEFMGVDEANRRVNVRAVSDDGTREGGLYSKALVAITTVATDKE